MASAQHSVTIRRPASDVFAFIADGTNTKRWRPGVLDIEHVSGEGMGAIYRQGVKGPGGRRIPADYEITAYEPNRNLAFRAIAGPVRPTGEYRFEETAEGTSVNFSLEATVTGWKSLVMGKAVQATMESEVRNLDTVKQILET
jgi:uncharacterized protein YndB with AHSA1/START domain